MILSSLQHSERIEPLHPLYQKLFQFVKQHDWLHEELGRYDVCGNDLYVLNILVNGVDQKEQPLEAHRQYIDVHILLEGKERIGWKSISDVSNEVKPYDPQGDCALYKEEASSYVDLLPGQFVIVYPEDPHAPVIGEGKIRKLIAKVAL